VRVVKMQVWESARGAAREMNCVLPDPVRAGPN
jgi:hypothetical protein